MIKSQYINKIDIVYTYVNSTDPNWEKKFKQYSNTIDASRFNFHGEIYFSLRSVQKFFNWVNNIYIICDNQPFSLDFLDENFRQKIFFIDHKDIIPNKYLPLFNSEPIECFLWKIKNLSDYFIYLNDDIFFGNYIFYNDFFDENNVFKIYYQPLNYYKDNNNLKKNRWLISHNSAELIFNNHFNTNLHISNFHISFNLNKHICKYTFNTFNKYLKKTFKLRFRKCNDLTNINSRNNFSFLHLCSLMMIYKKFANFSSIPTVIIQQLTQDEYNNLLKVKPKQFNINQLYSNQLILWNKLQKTYFDSIDKSNNEYKKSLKELK